MTRILMRAHSGPFDNPSHYDAIGRDLIGSNAGNLVFSHSIARTLMLPGVEIDYRKMNRILSDEQVEEYNALYDCFVIPLANAMRVSFSRQLEILTDTITRLDMPCIVVGVGYQGDLSSGADDLSHPWDDNVRRFVDAVLGKSALLGLRGETTARYCEHLGYERERDFTVIGCPSMYLHGADLPAPKPLDLTSASRLNVNFKAGLSDEAIAFMMRVCDQVPDHYFVPQNTYELRSLYSGRPLRDFYDKHIAQGYPDSRSHRLYKDNRVRGFVNVESWMRFLAKGDLNFGSRIHGNIVGVLAGVPAFIAAPDSRVLELAEYHRIPHMTTQEFEKFDTIFDIIDGIDFSQVNEGHRERFEHYLEFLGKNGLSTIYDEPCTTVPFDEKIAAIDFAGPVIPYRFSPITERPYRIRLGRKQNILAK